MNPTLSDGSNEKVFDEFNTENAQTGRLQCTVSASGDKVGVFRTSVESSLAAAADRLAKIREESLNRGRAAVQATDDYVHGNTWRVIGLVAVLGVIAGVVASVAITRRGSHKARRHRIP
ncbi:MAG TPA: hypothetical protein VM532_15845 [Burkholderiales bacterium]|nr:hypothetical protein [Burkholderiales bacterium]